MTSHDPVFLKSKGGIMTSQGPGCEPAWNFGWVDRPETQIETSAWLRNSGKPVMFADAAPHLMAADDDTPLFFWDAEQALLGKILESWDQSSIGSCVSHGWGRAVQDLLLWEIYAGGELEMWPGAQVCREAIYGGSRVEVGGGQIHGDGSTGGWAAKWCKDWGVILYKKYEVNGKTYDLSDGYTVSRCRAWGNQGCPNDLEPIAKEHGVREVALITSEAELWAAVGAGKPVPICSDVGFDAPLDADGYCKRKGNWGHCMTYRARFVHPRRGRSFVDQNSWGDYVHSDGKKVDYIAKDGSTKQFTLPGGCFCVPIADAMVVIRQQESYAVAGFSGWKSNRVDHSI